MLPLFTRYLTPEDYGIVALVGIVTLVLTGVFSLGIVNALGICYFEQDAERARHHIVWTAAGTIAANAALWCGVGYLAAPYLSLLVFGAGGREYALRLALLSLFFASVASPFLSYLRLRERARTFVLISLVSTAATLALSLAFVVALERGVHGLLEANLLAQGIVLAVTLLIVAPEVPFGIAPAAAPSLVRIGAPSIFGLGAFYVTDYVDRAMLQRLVGVEEVGVYALGYSFGLVMLLAVDAFGSAWPPYFVSFINRRAEAELLFGQILRYYLLAFGTLALLFFAFARPMVQLLTAPRYHAAYTVVGLVALAYLLKGCYLILLPGIIFARRLILQSAVEWMAALLTVLLNLLLIPILHKVGAALATSLAYCTLPVLTYFLGRRYLSVQYNWPGICRWGIGFFGAAAALSLLNKIPSSALQVLPALLVLALYGGYVLYGVLTLAEREQVLRILGRR